ncbi:NAD(P)-dependent oxidoreductase [Anaerolentibacter hominis]|uniref:NAD(P)-dependent oxidoreductase n=1 Tax=Anaerolentibacter hominis TaxID=3079009 RepID=UPI0031B87EDC
MFQKMVVIGPTKLTDDSKVKLKEYASEVIYNERILEEEDDLARVIGDADGVLVTLEIKVTRKVIEQCPNIRYIGMCCSLYSPESANVDIIAANERGIVVTGIRDYGDEGVVEYVISELVQLLHGFGKNMWKQEPYELTGQKIGVLGMGTLGTLISRALKFFGADVSYYSRTRKPEREAEGIRYRELDDLMQNVDICIGCLNKNAIIVHQEQLDLFGNGKILMNVSIGPFTDDNALRNWLKDSSNYFMCDKAWCLGDESLEILPNVLCLNKGAGSSYQLIGRYNKKVLGNIEAFLEAENK